MEYKVDSLEWYKEHVNNKLCPRGLNFGRSGGDPWCYHPTCPIEKECWEENQRLFKKEKK